MCRSGAGSGGAEAILVAIAMMVVVAVDSEATMAAMRMEYSGRSSKES